MDTLQPNPVPPSSWRHWLADAAKLSSRRLPVFVVLCGVAFATSIAMSVLERGLNPTTWYGSIPMVFTLLVLYGVMATAVLVAQAADYGRTTYAHLAQRWPACRGELLGAMGSWLVMILLGYLIHAAVLGVHSLVGIYQPAPPALSQQLLLDSTLEWVWLNVLLLPLATCLIGLWFFLPLVVCADCPRRMALKLAVDAFSANPFVWGVGFGWAFLTLILPEPFFIAIIPLMGAMIYVSYRHVFWGRLHSKDPKTKAVAVGGHGEVKTPV
ncbi:MAG: hypothetical protein ACFCBW_03705 [Candidatus Competibacterales bacterium]